MAVLTPSPKMQFESAAGVPLSGGKLYTYTAGTTTPLATFTDSTGATPNPNPVILDSRGEAAIWLGSATYKFKLTDANDVEIWTVDYISAPTTALSPVLSGNVTIDSDTPGPALKITQTGTGAVLRVQDSADPDTTPFIIDGSGNVGLGTPTPSVQFEATGAARIGSLTLTSTPTPAVQFEATGAAEIGSLTLTAAPLPVASGGTGATTLTLNNVLLGNGTSAPQTVAPGSSGNYLRSNGTTWASAALPQQITATTGSPAYYAARAWVNFDGTTSPGTIRASQNVSSVTRNSTGNYTVNFATAMPDTNYCALITAKNSGITESESPVSSGAYGTGSFTFSIVRDGVGPVNVTFCNVAIFR